MPNTPLRTRPRSSTTAGRRAQRRWSRSGLALLLLAAGLVAGPASAQKRSHERPTATQLQAQRAGAGGQAPGKTVRQTREYAETLGRAGAVDRVASSLGFGNLVGLGLPVFILVGGAMRVMNLDPPAFLASYVDPHSPLYSWPFMLLAMLALGLFVLSGNEKVSKGPKLLAQIAGIPPAVLLAVAVPIVAELSRPDVTTAMLAQAGGVPEGAVGAASLSVGAILAALGLGLVALFSASLILLTRLFVSFVVWLSPFPFIDALVNVVFHAYAGALILLTFVAPPAALFLMVVQTFVALLLLRRLLRFGRASARIGKGALRWHLLRGGLSEATDISSWAAEELDTHATADTPRLMGWILDAHGHVPHSSAAVGLAERAVHLVSSTWRRRTHHAIPAMELHEVVVRYGGMHDAITFVHRQGSGGQRREVPLEIGLAKSQRKALVALCAELRERGYDVTEATEKAEGRPRAVQKLAVA
jgi:hypothetical protein